MDAIEDNAELRPIAPSREAVSPEQELSMSETVHQVHAAVADLPERQREAIVLFAIEGMKYREISDVMGAPVNTVKTFIHRARQKLVEELGPLLDAPRQ